MANFYDFTSHITTLPGFGAAVVAVDHDNRVFIRKNVQFKNPSGTNWVPVSDLRLSDVSAGYNAIYGVTVAGKIVRFTGDLCGGVYTAASGSFQSPEFPLYYPTDVHCLYVIRPKGKVFYYQNCLYSSIK